MEGTVIEQRDNDDSEDRLKMQFREYKLRQKNGYISMMGI